MKILLIRHSCERRNPKEARLNAVQQHFSHTAWIAAIALKSHRVKPGMTVIFMSGGEQALDHERLP